MKNLLILFFVLAGAALISCEDQDTATDMQGKGGSTARFALANDHLYVVDDRDIQVYAIEADGAVRSEGKVIVTFGVETIFAKGNYLFLGADDAMYTYDISTPSTPSFVSRYDHLLSCDPVVVNGQYAYVTLRVRENCRESGADALEIIDISNIQSPSLVKSYPMTSPYGLGIDGNMLFVCEGDNGLKIYNAADPSDISLTKQYDMNAFDVIPNDGVLVLTGSDGIFQYDYSDPEAIELLSHITVVP